MGKIQNSFSRKKKLARDIDTFRQINSKNHYVVDTFASDYNSECRCKKCKRKMDRCICIPRNYDNFKICCKRCKKTFGKCKHSSLKH